MLLQNIRPFARFVRYLRINEESVFYRNIPLDARLFYTMEGEGRILIGGQQLTVKPGSILYIPAGVPYHIQPGKVTYLAVNFDFTQAHSHMSVPIEPVRDLGQQPQVLERVDIRDAECFRNFYLCREPYELCRDLQIMENVYAKKLPWCQQELSARLMAVLTCIARQAGKRPSRGERFDLEAVMEYIHSHLHEKLDNHTLADKFHFHPNYLSAEFKNSVGQPLHSYVLEARILHAVTQMDAGQRNLEKIAQDCGFSTVNYFIRAFKKHMGIPPGAYIRAGQ